MKNKEVKKILKWNKFVFGKEINIKFRKHDGEIVEFLAKKGTVFYEEKDVRKIIRILENENQSKR